MNRYIYALFTKHKKKHLPKRLQGTWFDEWMSYGYITFITSFILQGMLYANWRDNVIKIGMDVVITILLSLVMPWWAGLFIAHVINYCINGQAICVFYHIKAGNMTAQAFYDGTVAMQRRLQKDKCVAAAISYGSLSKGRWHNSSDIDIRFIPAKGEWNFWKACLVGLRERMIAFFRAYPLDMYIFTMKHSYDVMSKDEMPIVFKDVNNEAQRYYKELMSFEDFKKMFTHEHLKK
ncbi:MAG: nucleotidyltransferase domain-containing protein [Bacteroidales bacterium]|nr:nucleotidyltransferase domain-containing protein [Bacteroidales bacterium]MCM1146230.1 nucleotidyltransferase domain-containing protein [Bacteroidales bacterium]MCM1205332.1 nucleotidyltransferase domain-containing protein [Bacillota bacterium]MCM1509581.1 nucleotidyltransferase domain-containing protein [Clostridium sp.]